MTDPRLRQRREGAPRLRRLALVLPALLVVAALLVAAAPTEARSRMALGVSQVAGSRDIQAVHDFAASVGGNYPATWTIWSTWGKASTKGFPTTMVKQLKAAGVTPMIWWEPMKQEFGSCAYAQHRKIANGKFDKYIKNWARAAKKTNTKILVRYSHEINGRYFPYTVGRCGNTVDHYKKSWRRVHNLVRNNVGAKNVKFVWTVAKKSCGTKSCNPYKKFYPGHKYVQYAGFSSFNWGSHKSWKTMDQGLSLIMKKMRQFTGKPIIVAELASSPNGGTASSDNKPNWIRTGYEKAYTKYPGIKGIVWLNVDLRRVGHPDWSLNNPSGAKTAYKDIVSQDKFQGRY